MGPVSRVEDGGEGALKGRRAEISGLREQEGALAIVVAERRRSGWSTRVLAREVRVIVDEGEDVALEREEKEENSPRILTRSPGHRN